MRLRIIITLSLALIFSLFSCTKKQKDISFRIQNVDTILQEYNSGRTSKDHGEYLEGQIYIRYASDNRLAVYIGRAGTDKSLFYLLETSKKLDQSFELVIEEGQILFLKDHLVINSLNAPKSYLFKVNRKARPKSLEQLVFDEEFSGFGLGRFVGYPLYNAANNAASQRNNGAFGLPGDPPAFELAPTCKCRKATEIDDDCNAGGHGSTSCSITDIDGNNCQTDCEAGYFSCCRYSGF